MADEEGKLRGGEPPRVRQHEFGVEEKEVEKWRSRAIILRASDGAYEQVIRLLEHQPDCYIVYQKSSNQRLVIREEVY